MTAILPSVISSSSLPSLHLPLCFWNFLLISLTPAFNIVSLFSPPLLSSLLLYCFTVPPFTFSLLTQPLLFPLLLYCSILPPLLYLLPLLISSTCLFSFIAQLNFHVPFPSTYIPSVYVLPNPALPTNVALFYLLSWKNSLLCHIAKVIWYLGQEESIL